MNKPIYHITPFSMLDFPDMLSCIIWFAGCNMNCGYCYNVDVVRGKGKMDFKTALEFLKTRRQFLDGVVLSGGECLMHHDLEDFIPEIKSLGLKVKVDTNGSQPKQLEKLIHKKLLDYVALDFKAMEDAFIKVTGINRFREFVKCFELLKQSGIPFEVRATYHMDVLDMDTLQQMANFLEERDYAGPFYIQNFFSNCKTLGNLNNHSVKIKANDLNTKRLQIEIRN